MLHKTCQIGDILRNDHELYALEKDNLVPIGDYWIVRDIFYYSISFHGPPGWRYYTLTHMSGRNAEIDEITLDFHFEIVRDQS